jgi:predicted metal-dependent peptidase
MAQAQSTATDLPTGDISPEDLEKLLGEAEEYDLSPHLVNLLLNEPFFSTLLRKVTKIKSMSISTAGVTVRDAEFMLLWNPVFVMELESLKVRGLLKHEMYHLIFKHCTGRKQDPHMLWNWATDLAINSLISERELPDEGLRPGRPLDLSKITDPAQLEKWKKVSDLIESLPLEKASEWYMLKLQQDKDIQETIEENKSGKCNGNCQPGGKGEPCSGECNCGLPGHSDDHEGWGNISDEERQIAEGKIKQAVSEAVKRCDRNGQWGSVSSTTRETLRRMVNDAVDWKRVLQNFCGMSQRASKSRTHKRVNRKYPYVHPGVRRGHSASVAIYMDQSGSVGNDEVELFFGALNQLGRITKFTLFPFDYSVDEKNSLEWRKGQTLPPVRTRSGGTSFHPIEKHVRENLQNFDGHIILTDGEAADPGPSRQRRCWVLLPNTKLIFKPHRNDIVITMDRPPSNGS